MKDKINEEELLRIGKEILKENALITMLEYQEWLFDNINKDNKKIFIIKI
ncbi:hypothetical protein [Clostridium beijerinckii]|nr:hypothetical protein [Clostridium beijerinckii]NRU52479.1 hypothetical protein [Clostridium beijerinckii]NYC69076.1 hypothetical protein [Clostridium beijerinckii]NYC91662.1 hypothetical protein [Clostridium beijerinckii]NYC91680.1 hypothetical protein [Clostridium beijerinckii]